MCSKTKKIIYQCFCAARGGDVNAANSDGATPLHDAVARGDEAIVRILLEHQANPHIQCYKGYDIFRQQYIFFLLPCRNKIKLNRGCLLENVQPA